MLGLFLCFPHRDATALELRNLNVPFFFSNHIIWLSCSPESSILSRNFHKIFDLDPGLPKEGKQRQLVIIVLAKDRQ